MYLILRAGHINECPLLAQNRQGLAGRVAHCPDVLEALHIHQPQHTGFLRHPLEGRQVGVDGGRSPPGVSQKLSNTHDVVPAQAAPAAEVRTGGAQHPCDDPEEGGHGLPAAGRVQGKEVGPGRINRSVMAGQGREKFLIQRDRGCQKIAFLSVIRYQAPAWPENIRRAA